jgi:hypothetical protein
MDKVLSHISKGATWGSRTTEAELRLRCVFGILVPWPGVAQIVTEILRGRNIRRMIGRPGTCGQTFVLRVGWDWPYHPCVELTWPIWETYSYGVGSRAGFMRDPPIAAPKFIPACRMLRMETDVVPGHSLLATLTVSCPGFRAATGKSGPRSPNLRGSAGI